MADTLSRKHRLKQQQREQQQQQFARNQKTTDVVGLYGVVPSVVTSNDGRKLLVDDNRENQKKNIHEQFKVICRNSEQQQQHQHQLRQRTNLTKNGSSSKMVNVEDDYDYDDDDDEDDDDDDDDDDDGFEVFKVVEIGTNASHCERTRKQQVSSDKRPQNNQLRNRKDFTATNSSSSRYSSSSSSGNGNGNSNRSSSSSNNNRQKGKNFKGQVVNSVRNGNSSSSSSRGSGQIERRNENNFEHCETDDFDYNHHHHHEHWREQDSIYERSTSSRVRKKSHQQSTEQLNFPPTNHLNHAINNSSTNRYQSPIESLSILNAGCCSTTTTTTKSIGGNSSSGFSSSNGSYNSSSSQQQQQQQQNHHHHHQHHVQQQQQHQTLHGKDRDCVVVAQEEQVVSKGSGSGNKNNNNNNHHQHRRRQTTSNIFAEQEVNKMMECNSRGRSKLIDDLDRLLKPPRSESTLSSIGGGSSRSPKNSSNHHHRSRSRNPNRLINNHNHDVEDDEEIENQLRRSSLVVSPTESHISTATTTTNSSSPAANGGGSHNSLGRGANFDSKTVANDFDYSTLCRDEFSSFIQVEPTPPSTSKHDINDDGDNVDDDDDDDDNDDNHNHPASVIKNLANCLGGGGPMLIGVHETESSNVRNARILSRRHDGNDNDVDVDIIMSDDGQESDEIRPYDHDDFRNSGNHEEEKEVDDDCDNVYEEIPGPSRRYSSPSSNSIGDNDDGQMSSSPPIVSISPSYSPSSEMGDDPSTTSCSPIVCQNYSPDELNVMTTTTTTATETDDYNDDYDEEDYNNKSLEAGSPKISHNNQNLHDGSMFIKNVINNKCDSLSEKIDIYVERVNTLVRLTKSDKSISIQEAFRSYDNDNDSKINEYHLCSQESGDIDYYTPIKFVPHTGGRENFMQIIQEVKYETPTADTDSSGKYLKIQDTNNCNRRTIVTDVREHTKSQVEAIDNCSTLKSILESIQTMPELSWSLQQRPQQQQGKDNCDNIVNDLVNNNNNSNKRRRIRNTDIELLEKSLISRLGDLTEADNDPDNDNDLGSHVIPPVAISIIREHITEFIENYNTYQMELSRETSFGDGSWHENWLFSTKRPRSDQTHHYQESSRHHEVGVSSTKRARFDSAHNEDQKRAHEMQTDLIKYSTLILARSKPIKLTLFSDENNNSNHNHGDPCRLSEQLSGGCPDISSHIGGFYEAQLDRVSELEMVVIESSRQTDVCRLLLRDTDTDTGDDDDDDDDEHTMDSNNNNNNKRNKKGKKKTRLDERRNKSLLISYDSTSLMPTLHNSMNKFYFTASGYLIQTNLIKFPIGNPKLRAKIERKILDKLISSVVAGQSASSNRHLDQQQQQQQKITTVNTYQVMVATTDLLVSSSNGSSSSRTNAVSEHERARFVISLSNIELINRLPVIQFCAKISGSLPIRVRWFRKLPAGTTATSIATATDSKGERHNNNNNNNNHHHHHQNNQLDGYEELSDVTLNKKRKNLNIRSMADWHSKWPIELQASYDYEYETISASWYRFKRNKDQILFEIREPKLEIDYNRVYKCLIENTCSRRECKFQLTTKSDVVNSSPSDCYDRRQQQQQKVEVKSNNNRKQSASKTREIETVNTDGHALLRTWSQRTLNKPQPTEPKVPTDTPLLVEQQQQQQSIDNDVRLPTGRQQTVGRLSASSMKEADKFGKNFPYHPENLLKRLEENKFSISTKRKLGVLVPKPSTTMNDDDDYDHCKLNSTTTINEHSLESAEIPELATSSPSFSSSNSNSRKIFIGDDDDDQVKSYYQKQLQSLVKRKQLASANNNNSGLNSAHADSMMELDSLHHRNSHLVNSSSSSKNNNNKHDDDDDQVRFGCSSGQDMKVDYNHVEANGEKFQIAKEPLHQESQRTVINPHKPLSKVNLVVDDSVVVVGVSDRLKVKQQQQLLQMTHKGEEKSQVIEEVNVERIQDEDNRDEPRIQPEEMQLESPIKLQPRPRLRLSQRGATNYHSKIAEQDEKENYRSNEQVQSSTNKSLYNGDTNQRVAVINNKTVNADDGKALLGNNERKKSDDNHYSTNRSNDKHKPPTKINIQQLQSAFENKQQQQQQQQLDDDGDLIDNRRRDKDHPPGIQIPPLSVRNHQKSSGSNVKSLISRFSLA